MTGSPDDIDFFRLADTAFSAYRAGRVAEARRGLAGPVRIAFERGEAAISIDPLPEIVALSIEVDLAAGMTSAAERCYALLDSWEARIAIYLASLKPGDRPKRTFRFPRHAGRMWLAATGRLGLALDSVAVEVASATSDTLWEGTPARYRLDLAVRAQDQHEIVNYGSQWQPEPGQRSSSAAVAVREEADDLLLHAAVHIARARITSSRRASLSQARQLVLDAVQLLDEQDDALLRLRASLLLGQIGRLNGAADAESLLRDGQTRAAAMEHRDLGGQFALELADVLFDRKDVAGARTMAAAALELACSQDGGRHIQPTLDSAHALMLRVDRRLARSPESFLAIGAERRETIILVHGTFAPPKAAERQWYERGSEFCQTLDSELAACASTARCWAHLGEGVHEFFWSGLNDWIDRNEAAADLAAYLEALHQHWRCHIVAHSHGGNVSHQAIALLRAKGIEWDGRLVTFGTPFFHSVMRDKRPSRLRFLRGMNVDGLTDAIDKRAGEELWPRALAISSHDDEALKILELALEIREPPGTRGGPSLWSLARETWTQTWRVARAQKKRIPVRPIAFLRGFVLRAASPMLMRLVWNAGRNRITGLDSSVLGVDSVQVKPEVAIDGRRGPSKCSSLPADIVFGALNERREEVKRSQEAIQRFLDGERWSWASVDQLLESVSTGKLVHSVYYRDRRCIKVTARWLSVPESTTARDPFAAVAARELSDPFGSPVEDLWAVPLDDEPGHAQGPKAV